MIRGGCNNMRLILNYLIGLNDVKCIKIARWFQIKSDEFYNIQYRYITLYY